jgi:hypothetical protein
MGSREFRWRLAGLSDASRFRGAISNETPRIDDPVQAGSLLRSI